MQVEEYEDKLYAVKTSLLGRVRRELAKRYNTNEQLYWWNYQPIKEVYVICFLEEFPESMTPLREEKLKFAGQNVAYMIQTVLDTAPRYKLDPLLQFVESFVMKQLDDFEEWIE